MRNVPASVSSRLKPTAPSYEPKSTERLFAKFGVNAISSVKVRAAMIGATAFPRRNRPPSPDARPSALLVQALAVHPRPGATATASLPLPERSVHPAAPPCWPTPALSTPSYHTCSPFFT